MTALRRRILPAMRRLARSERARPYKAQRKVTRGRERHLNTAKAAKHNSHNVGSTRELSTETSEQPPELASLEPPAGSEPEAPPEPEVPGAGPGPGSGSGGALASKATCVALPMFVVRLKRSLSAAEAVGR